MLPGKTLTYLPRNISLETGVPLVSLRLDLHFPQKPQTVRPEATGIMGKAFFSLQEREEGQGGSPGAHLPCGRSYQVAVYQIWTLSGIRTGREAAI